MTNLLLLLFDSNTIFVPPFLCLLLLFPIGYKPFGSPLNHFLFCYTNSIYI